jgi:hypothetical protein
VVAVAAPHGSALRLGSVPLQACTKRPRTYCGHVMVPLDYASAASPRIRIGFRWLPASGHAVGTVLAVEGGPGFATTGTQGAYLAMMGPLKRGDHARAVITPRPALPVAVIIPRPGRERRRGRWIWPGPERPAAGSR